MQAQCGNFCRTAGVNTLWLCVAPAVSRCICFERKRWFQCHHNMVIGKDCDLRYTHSKSFVDLLLRCSTSRNKNDLHQQKWHFLPLATVAAPYVPLWNVSCPTSQLGDSHFTTPPDQLWKGPDFLFRGFIPLKKWRTYYIFFKQSCWSFLHPQSKGKNWRKKKYIYIDNIIVLVWCWDLFPELTSFLPGWSFVLQLFPANLPVKDGWSTKKNAFRKAGWQSDDVFVPWCSAGWKTYRTVESRQWKVIRLMFWDPVFSQKKLQVVTTLKFSKNTSVWPGTPKNQFQMDGNGNFQPFPM